MYRLIYDPGIEATQDQLPPAASAALTIALEVDCHDPIGDTLPRGLAEEWNREVHTAGAIALSFVSHAQKTVAVLEIIPLA
ncbi:hypothetical protein [Streptomyces inhibens]|uniref:hypothetical protein n=1 Tax=Streptomyces inhibens TaxID=2293571 RepID=UPI001EE73ABA|nr:hypothetical protein [Streptomyces inhibens]UKY54272.1 hypothetical protein KI385_39315 [Streptomyces inhibens]